MRKETKACPASERTVSHLRFSNYRLQFPDPNWVPVRHGQRILPCSDYDVVVQKSTWLYGLIFLADCVRERRAAQSFRDARDDGIDLSRLIETIGLVVADIVARAIDRARLDQLRGRTFALELNSLEYCDTVGAGTPNLNLLERLLTDSSYMIEEAKRLGTEGFGCLTVCCGMRLALLQDAVEHQIRTGESLRRDASNYADACEPLLDAAIERAREGYDPPVEHRRCRVPFPPTPSSKVGCNQRSLGGWPPTFEIYYKRFEREWVFSSCDECVAHKVAAYESDIRDLAAISEAISVWRSLGNE